MMRTETYEPLTQFNKPVRAYATLANDVEVEVTATCTLEWHNGCRYADDIQIESVHVDPTGESVDYSDEEEDILIEALRFAAEEL